jgi:hypothetical protein
MKRTKCLLFLIPFFVYTSFSKSDLKWEETGMNKKTEVKPGIPAFGGAVINYTRDGKTALRVSLEDPVVISVASKPEGWGFFQFPGIYKSFDGLLVSTWAMCEDAASDYGKGGSGFMLSSDNGKTWYSSDQPVAGGGGLVLPGGDRISIHTPVALKVSELRLPEPLTTNLESYRRTFSYYRHDELPDTLRGVYITRTDNTGKHSLIHAVLDDPKAVRYTDGELFPIVWWGDMKLLPDNSIIAGTYPAFYENDEGGVDPSGVSFYRSTDQGMTWKILGKIPYSFDPVADPNGKRRLALGFTEPAFDILQDGTFVCVIRTTDGYGISPMYISRSSDQGVTWSHPEVFTPSGVLPRLLQLENGVVVLASGRPGVQLRFSTDGKGEQWTDPFEMLPFEENERHDKISCGYPCLLATGPDRFLVIYSDFKYLNQDKEIRKAIKVREVRVTRK